MLVKLSPEVNFINVLRAAFTRPDPESAKKQSSCQSFMSFWDLGKYKLLVEHWWNWHLNLLLKMLYSFINKTTDNFSNTKTKSYYQLLQSVFDLRCTPVTKISRNLIEQKLLIKCWWYRAQGFLEKWSFPFPHFLSHFLSPPLPLSSLTLSQTHYVSLSLSLFLCSFERVC